LIRWYPERKAERYEKSDAKERHLCVGGLLVKRVLDGDTVVVEVFGEEKHSAIAADVPSQSLQRIVGNEGAQVASDTAEATVAGVEGLPYAATEATGSVKSRNNSAGAGAAGGAGKGNRKGRVVAVLKKTWRQFAGSLSRGDAQSEGFSGFSDTAAAVAVAVSAGDDESLSAALFVPVDKKVPCIRIFTRRLGALLGKRVLVAVDEWPAESLFPVGHYVRSLGNENEKEVETQVLLTLYRMFVSTLPACFSVC